MQKLKILGLAMNPLAKSPNYREQVFNYLHDIQVLDHNDRTGAERLIESDSENEDDLSSGLYITFNILLFNNKL